jgi:hypothetical protein|tara:strand:- start:224 stop:640 length:417 start_codon:yes stop_codon:yes gene_type:complete
MSYNIADLELGLNNLELDAEKASDITAIITDFIYRWAKNNGWNPRLEYYIKAYRTTKSGRVYQGVVDVYIERFDGPDIVVEIDRGNKKWSVQKLNYCRIEGLEAIWIKWGSPISLDIPEGITAIHLNCRYRREEVRKS